MLQQPGWSGAKQHQQPVVKEEPRMVEETTQKTVEGENKSESTCDVGDSKKLETTAIVAALPSCTSSSSASGGTDKGKNEFDSRMVQFKEMERNFERILASVATTAVEEVDTGVKEEVKREHDNVMEGETVESAVKEAKNEMDLPVAMKENNEGAGTSTAAAEMNVGEGANMSDGAIPPPVDASSNRNQELVVQSDSAEDEEGDEKKPQEKQDN